MRYVCSNNLFNPINQLSIPYWMIDFQGVVRTAVGPAPALCNISNSLS